MSRFVVGQVVKVPFAGAERQARVISVLDPRVEAYLEQERPRERRVHAGEVFVELTLADGAARLVRLFPTAEVRP